MAYLRAIWPRMVLVKVAVSPDVHAGVLVRRPELSKPF